MEQAWRIRVWGVRGSRAAADASYLEYGGNTPCISIERDGELMILDAGSGLFELGQRLVQQPVRRLDLYLSHLHIDHVEGLFGFPPLTDPTCRTEVHLYGRVGLQASLERLIGRPWWPVGLQDCTDRVVYHELEPGTPFQMHHLRGTTMEGNHPGGSLLCRLESDGKCVVYALDCESDAATMSRLIAFARDAQLLIWDASYTPSDVHPGWGHSSWQDGLAVGHAAGVGTILMSHYSRGYPDAVLRRQEMLAMAENVSCRFAREGMVLTL